MSVTATFISDLLDHHLDELGFLWMQWNGSLRDPDYTLKAVRELEERIRGHMDGVRVPGERALPRLMELLEGEDEDLAFAAAYSLLQMSSPKPVDRVLDRFAASEDDVFSGLCRAIAHGPLPPTGLERVRSLLSAGSTTRAIAAAEVLAFHNALELTGDQLRYFMEDEDPAVRTSGWRVIGLVGVQLPPKFYAAALREETASVTAAALEAGAWSGEQGVLAALRHLAESPAPEHMELLQLLGVLGRPEDLPRIQALVESADLGPDRFRLAGTFGHPALMQQILAALEDPDPSTAAAAGSAFMKLTGLDIESDLRATLPPPDGSEPDEFDLEFLEEVTLPDAAQARKRWVELEPSLGQTARVCCGVDMGQSPAGAEFERLDMESRWESMLRGRFSGTWTGSRLELERFPHGPR